MRTLGMFLVGFFLVAGIAAHAQEAEKTSKPFIHATVEQTEASLTKALESGSPGLQVSAAATVRELKAMLPDRPFSGLVIPLMAIVKNEDADRSARIVAAIALHELRSSKGDYAIKTMAHFTSDERVAYICSWLSYDRMKEENPNLASRGTGAVAENTNSK